MNRFEGYARLATSETHRAVSAFLAEPGRYMSPAEREWWRRLLGNLEKAQHDNPHLSARRGEGTHNG